MRVQGNTIFSIISVGFALRLLHNDHVGLSPLSWCYALSPVQVFAAERWLN